MHKNKMLLIDFDSTFVAVESLDQLAKIVLKKRTDRQKILDEIEAITKLGMEGKIIFPESLAKRLQLFKPNKKHIDRLIQLLRKNITPSFQRNKKFFQENAENVYILSSGFKEYMIPVLEKYGIDENHILGNAFLFNEKGQVIGYDDTNPLTKEEGKVKMIKKMNFTAPLVMVGDGFTDYEVKKAGLAKKFIAFTENVTRATVLAKADAVAKTFEEVLENI